jgi:SRF-type transcription factor (DNA-binding and dimerisation domain)
MGAQFRTHFGVPYRPEPNLASRINTYHPQFSQPPNCLAKTQFTADMTFQPIKVVRRRRLDTKRAKRQQQTRRKDNLFKKALEYSLECGAYVYLAIKIKKNGQIFTFNSDSTGEWPLPEAQMVHNPRKVFRMLMESRIITIHSRSE